MALYSALVIFIVFRLCQSKSNYRKNEFYKVASKFDKGEITLQEIEDKLDNSAQFAFNDDSSFKSMYIYDYINALPPCNRSIV